MHPEARLALDTYLTQNPRVGEAWLFHSDKDATSHLRIDVAGRWLVQAEALAGLPKLKHGRWHPYRRLWAMERKHLPDVDVAAAGGWRGTQALKLSYQQPDPATVLRVVQAGAERH